MALTEYGKQMFKEYFNELKQINDLFTKEEMQEITKQFMSNGLDRNDILKEINRRINEQ